MSYRPTQTINVLGQGRYLCRLVLWNNHDAVDSASVCYLNIAADGRVVVSPFVRELASTPFIDGAIILVASEEGWRDIVHDTKKDCADPYKAAQSFLSRGILASTDCPSTLAVHYVS